ncbi:MAG: hypothetical protein BWY31_00569 [Lentisphaerae bacterium ADurb.Bin242]|nr:MAG: hypothetical protein BWY31_00569 [Lentisphaerae bacterium ADurb.Bin242]
MNKKFTLIELLVVISIIAILASLLLPALNQAKERAKGIKCIANLKSCVMGLQSYADVNKDFFPAASSIVDGRTYGWAGVLVYDRHLPDARKYSYDTIFLCPSAQYVAAESGGWNSYGGRSYGLAKGTTLFGELGNYTADPTYYHIRRSTIARGEFQKVPLGGDSIHTRDLYQANALMMSDPSVASRGVGIGSNRTLHMRHSGQANVFYSDGHTAPLRKVDITGDTWMTYARATNNGIF